MIGEFEPFLTYTSTLISTSRKDYRALNNPRGLLSKMCLIMLGELPILAYDDNALLVLGKMPILACDDVPC